MKITDFISGPVTYDQCGGTYFWVNRSDGGIQMLAQMRGWGAIQNLFSTVGAEEAEQFQDSIGNWIAEAINEKLERENTTNGLTPKP